jgi:hypothetical protein
LAARAEAIRRRMDELLVLVGRATDPDNVSGQMVLAMSCARLTADPMAAATVAGPLVGVIVHAFAELAEATGRSVDEVVADYRVKSAAAVDEGLRMIRGDSAA